MSSPQNRAAYAGNPQDRPTVDNAQASDQLYDDDPFGGIKQAVTDPSPSPQVVNAFHKRSDKDSSVNAGHHTLGPGHNQASPGDHKHDGTSSKALLAGVTINTSRSDLTTAGALQQLMNALVALGMTNNSTP